MTTVTHRNGVGLLNDLMVWLNSAGTEPGVHVAEMGEGDHPVIRADLPGADPAKDIDGIVGDGIVWLHGSCRPESGPHIRSFERLVSWPRGTTADEITADHGDDVLIVSVPTTRPVAPQAIPVTHREPSVH